jgi:hypothetical protein
MKKLLIALSFVGLTACSSITGLIPSKWDDNQSRAAVDLQVDVRHFDCAGDQKAQLAAIARQVEWFNLYAASKGTDDMAKLNAVFATTVKEYQDRLNQGPVSPIYCDLKKKIMIQQADIISKAVLFRF